MDKHPERVKEEDKDMVEKLDYSGIEFPMSKKDYNKIEKKNGIRVNVFGYEKKQPYPIHISKEDFERELNLLLLESDGNKHYVLLHELLTMLLK